METASRSFDLGQDKGDANGGYYGTYLLYIGLEFGQRPVGGFQVSISILRYTQERRCLNTPDIIVLGREAERLPGVSYGIRYIAKRQRMIGTGSRYRGGQQPELCFIHDDPFG
jgi:hypothetical protein